MQQPLPQQQLPSAVLVVGRGLYALQLLRVFAEAKVPRIYLATSAALDFARSSFACSRSFVVPKPETGNLKALEEFSGAIQRIAFEQGVDLIVPAAEETLFVAYVAPQWFANGLRARVLTWKFADLDLLHDKLRFQELCQKIEEVRVPKTARVESVAELLERAEAIFRAQPSCQKVVVKPIYSRGGRSLWILPPPPFDEYEKLVSFLGPQRPHVVQEFIQGQELSSFSLVSNGEILAHACYRAEFPIKGFFTVRTAVRKPAIIDWVHRFVQQLDPNFSGFLGFDFIETVDGDLCALECNPRATNGVSFFACDRSLARAFCEAVFSAALRPSPGRAGLVGVSLPPRSPSPSPQTPHPAPATAFLDLSSTTPLTAPGTVIMSTTAATPSSHHLPKSLSLLSLSSLSTSNTIIEPQAEFSIATMLPALSLLKSRPFPMRLFRVLVQSHADIEWPSDPLPLFAALVKALNLLRTSMPKLLRGAKFADLAAQGTEDELVKYDAALPAQTAGLELNSTSSLSSWENDGDLAMDPPPLAPPTLPSPLAAPTPVRVLVTGATGFVGSNLAFRLASMDGYSVVATGRNREGFDNLLREKRELISEESRQRIAFVQCDLSDRSAVKALVKNVDVVVHCAAKCSPWGYRDDFIRDNVDVVRFLLESCSSKESPVTRFVHVSSPSVAFSIDETEGRMFVRESDPMPPEDKQANMYAASKMLAERLVSEFAANFKNKLCVVSIRPRAIYGTGDRALFPRIVSRLREQRLPQIGNGSTVVDLTHVDNVVHSLVLAMRAPKSVCHGRVYNITDCSPVKLWDVLHKICDELDFGYPKFTIPRAVAFRAAHAMEAVFGLLLGLGITEREPLLSRYAVNVLSLSQTLDCSLARAELGYDPVMTTEAGIAHFLDSIRESELKLPARRTDSTLALVVKPLMQALGTMLLAHLVLSYVLCFSGWYMFAAVAFLGGGRFFTARNAGAALLRDEGKRRRNRAKKVAAAAAADTSPAAAGSTGQDRARPWLHVQDVDLKFKEAVRAAPAIALSPAATSFVLDLYGLFKQQKDGDCNVPSPSITRVKDFAKWKSWNDRKGLTSEEAKREYVNVVDRAFDLLEEMRDPEAEREADLQYCKTKERVMCRLRIDGTGKYLPKRVVSTEEVQELCHVEANYSDVHNVGVKRRHWADAKVGGETNSFMAAQAVQNACKAAGVRIQDVDLIINASASAERVLPDGACLVKRALGLEASSVPCFSVHATCLSFLVGLDTAASFLASGKYKRICIVSSEVPSVACNFKQPESALLLGDAAAAAIVSLAPKGSPSCVHTSVFENYCRGVDAASLNCGTLTHPAHAPINMDNFVFDMDGKLIVDCVKEVGTTFLERVRPGLSSRLPHDISLVVPHQPSGAGLDILVAHGWPREKTVYILESTGNCVAASIPLTLCEAIESGRLKRGEKFLMAGTGGGITLGAMILTY